ncbi:MAG: class I SAM-dependent methyltransferase [Betaproteobacteria bacterium]
MPIVSRLSGQDRRAALYPAELLDHFDDSFISSFDRYVEFVTCLALQVLHSTGLQAACLHHSSVDEAIARAGLSPQIARVPAVWIFNILTQVGLMERAADSNGNFTYCSRNTPARFDAAALVDAQDREDPRWLPSYEIASIAAAHYPAVLRGEKSGEEALFGTEGIVPWVKYFSGNNPLYAISNTVGAFAAVQAMPKGPVKILEIGGGLGSGAMALLDRLAATGRAADLSSYCLTEISPLFLKRAQRNLAQRHAAFPISYAALDIDKPFSPDVAPPAGQSLVYGVNVLHVANDLGSTLSQIRNALREDGMLVMAECVRPFAGRPLHMELVFNLLTSFRDATLHADWRPNAGFLTPEQWTSALQTAKFTDIRIYPDIAGIRDDYPDFVIAAIVARRQ